MVYHAIEVLETLKTKYHDDESKNEINFAIKVLENLEDSLDAKQRNRASLFDF